MWLSILCLVFTVLALSSSVYLWLELRSKLSRSDIIIELQQSSEELKKTYGKSIKEIETEWDDMYEKFSRLIGRMDRRKQQLAEKQPVEEEPQMTRSDVLRKYRRIHNVQA